MMMMEGEKIVEVTAPAVSAGWLFPYTIRGNTVSVELYTLNSADNCKEWSLVKLPTCITKHGHIEVVARIVLADIFCILILL
jgi:hypothetical protein